MPTTIELFGIKAEVPEGHEDFLVINDRPSFRIVDQDEFGLDRFSLWDIGDIFAESDDFNLYRQRRVVDAARCLFYDDAEELKSRYEEIGGGRLWTDEECEQAKALLRDIRAAEHEADHWQLIGEAAEKVAKGGGE